MEGCAIAQCARAPLLDLFMSAGLYVAICLLVSEGLFVFIWLPESCASINFVVCSPEQLERKKKKERNLKKSYYLRVQEWVSVCGKEKSPELIIKHA